MRRFPTQIHTIPIWFSFIINKLDEKYSRRSKKHQIKPDLDSRGNRTQVQRRNGEPENQEKKVKRRQRKKLEARKEEETAKWCCMQTLFQGFQLRQTIRTSSIKLEEEEQENAIRTRGGIRKSAPISTTIKLHSSSSSFHLSIRDFYILDLD